MTTQTFIGTLVIEECYKCHCVFGITEDHHRRARSSGVEFFCPNGHGQVYSTTEEEKLRKKLEEAQRTAIRERNWRQFAESDAKTAQRSAAAYKGHLTRVRKLINAGICPVPECKRNFANVRGHMERMHPEWHVTDPDTGEAAHL